MNSELNLNYILESKIDGLSAVFCRIFINESIYNLILVSLDFKSFSTLLCIFYTAFYISAPLISDYYYSGSSGTPANNFCIKLTNVLY